MSISRAEQVPNQRFFGPVSKTEADDIAPKDEQGMCVACKEYTSILEPCCNAPVQFEGILWTPEEWEERQKELSREAV